MFNKYKIISLLMFASILSCTNESANEPSYEDLINTAINNKARSEKTLIKIREESQQKL